MFLLYLVRFGQCSCGQAEELFHICRMIKLQLPMSEIMYMTDEFKIHLLVNYMPNQASQQRENKEFLNYCQIYSNLFFNLSFT